MTVSKKRWMSRHLATAGIVFVVMFVLQQFALPRFPILGNEMVGAALAGAVAAAAWWLVSRWRKS